MDTESAFARIQSALEEFTADLSRALVDQAASDETVAAAEYEFAQLKKLLAEHTRAD